MTTKIHDEQYEQRIAAIRERVVDMYSRHPWPGSRNTDEEMGWRLKMLGITPADFRSKRVLDLGCGTGEYALWYARHGAAEVVGVDLAPGAIAAAEQRKRASRISNVSFLEGDILHLDLPDHAFDYVFSVGALHHTGDPYQGFQEMCRVVKPGGIVIVSLYNAYSRIVLRLKQWICKLLGGDDMDRRARWGRRLFPFTVRAFTKRHVGVSEEAISYDIFGFPHESLHTAAEVLSWFGRNGIDYLGSFAPLRIRDYFYAFRQSEYHSFKRTFVGFPLTRRFGELFHKLATLTSKPWNYEERKFRRPGPISLVLTQVLWFFIGTRINCFTVAGKKRISIIGTVSSFESVENLTSTYLTG